MTLTDTGPIVALLDRHDGYHARIRSLVDDVPLPLVTTEACLTESLHILGSISGWYGQSALWHLVNVGTLQILTPPPDGPQRANAYMARFKDQPCDYADATLLIAAEDLERRSIFTIDRHFYAYRLANGAALAVIG